MFGAYKFAMSALEVLVGFYQNLGSISNNNGLVEICVQLYKFRH